MSDFQGERLKVECLICAGEGSNDERRVRDLFSSLDADVHFTYVDRGRGKAARIWSVLGQLSRSGADFVFMEGTGVGGGIPLVIASLLNIGPRTYIVSSGDPVSAFVLNQFGPFMGWLARLYEIQLYRRCAAFVGWSPYLVGRAISMGARRGVTLEGAVPREFEVRSVSELADLRRQWGIEPGDFVVGVSGSLSWSERQGYCYGLELVNASKLSSREDLVFLVVGDGSGLQILKDRSGDDSRFRFVGRVSHKDMSLYIGIMDAAVISQTPDELGMLRLTTKLPEYLSIGVPVAMPAIPGALDYLSGPGDSPLWVLPPLHPATERYAEHVAAWLNNVSHVESASKGRAAGRVADTRFSLGGIVPRFSLLIESMKEDLVSR